MEDDDDDDAANKKIQAVYSSWDTKGLNYSKLLIFHYNISQYVLMK